MLTAPARNLGTDFGSALPLHRLKALLHQLLATRTAVADGQAVSTL
jgi:hypothetical protein